jgi:hypothetical protein
VKTSIPRLVVMTAAFLGTSSGTATAIDAKVCARGFFAQVSSPSGTASNPLRAFIAFAEVYGPQALAVLEEMAVAESAPEELVSQAPLDEVIREELREYFRLVRPALAARWEEFRS